MPSGAFNISCPRDCASRHNGGTSGAPLKPLRVDSALSGAFADASVSGTQNRDWRQTMPAYLFQEKEVAAIRPIYALAAI